ncbi:peptidoglycan-binding domain-containing protein [Defluviimonas aestuarii]|uniref:peptidoglycan-binding domain-containing protein n=1 Tax=Albidovulum aestuarii TaxID=1130726 RepID=UPI00249BE373|nr:peptidoglycan-binding domain-containing protein [Defluviimonas aestuarii]MDI3335199.1 peptidoglycan-binding domain-containing protein [Defluviimonas aestuarii]
MICKGFATGAVAMSLAFTPATPVLADAGDAIAGGIIGGLIGGAIVNESNKKRQRTVVRKSTSSGISSATRAVNRDTQVALNYFGYPVGAPDGVLGRQSRAAIAQYQSTLGYPATGYLTDYERNHLITSYHRAIAGGPVTMQQAAANPMGMRGLLLQWRDEAAGIVPQTQFAVTPTTPAPAPEAPAATEAMTEPETEPAAPGLPTFLGGGAVAASLASHCNRIGLMTSTNGGYMTAATMTDPMTALGEQFCLVRSFAIAEGEELAAKVPGVTKADISAQCAGFGPAMKAQVAALSLEPAEAVVADVRGFALSSGMAPVQLAATAKICLSVGYAEDNMDIAVASGLILAALGEGAYGELLGHHLSQGFGAAQRADLAFDWYDMAISAAATTGTVPFTPGQPDRMQLVRKAAYTIAGKADQASAPEAPAVLPTFVVPEASGEGEMAAAETAPATTVSADQVNALPLAARLPFLLFGD